MTLTFRPAQAADKEAVLAFTKNTWSWGDYIQWVWDDWLAATDGELTLALSDGEPAGMAKISLLTPSEAWLQGLRVNPRFRRQGIADAMTAYQIGWLRQRQVQVVRLGTYAENAATQTFAPRVGFRRMATYSILPHPAAEPGAAGRYPTVLTPADAADAWRMISASTVLRAAGGLYATGWAWQALTEQKLRAEIEQRRVAGLRGEDGHWSALAISSTDQDTKTLEIGYVDGRAGPLAELPGALARWAQQAGMEKVLAMLPAVPEILALFSEFDYGGDESEGPMYVYEMRLA